MILNNILKYPTIWNLSQTIFGVNSQKQQIIHKLVKKSGKLLDFGCADGNIFPAFQNFDYTGIDIDPNAIAYATKKYSSFSNAKFICTDILKNSLQKESFDSIIFSGTGHHLPNSLFFKITKSLSHLLKKDGSLYFLDSIKDDTRKSKLLSLIMSLDQGKFFKSEKFYNQNLNKFSKHLKPLFHKKYYLTNRFIPRPTIYIAEFSKI